METKQGMESIENLYIQLKNILKNDISTVNKVLRSVNAEYQEKGMSMNKLNMFLNGQIEVDQLDDYDLIALCKNFYNLGFKNFNPKNFFGELKIANYESYITVEEPFDKIILENFIKINDFEYRGQITYKQIYDYLSHSLIFYDSEAQRSPKFKKIGSKNGSEALNVRTENLNMKSVNEIAKSVLDKTFEDTELVFNCELLEGKNQKFKFISKYEDILGDIIIKPNYITQDDDTTWVSITDGFHRCKGIVSAINKHLGKTGEYLEGSIGLRLVRADKERAKRIVYQTFLRSADEPEWIDSLQKNDYTKFVDMVLKESKLLTVDNTIDLANMNEKLTSKSLLVDFVKKMNIKVNISSDAYFKSKKIAKDFDLIYSIAKSMGVEFNVYKVAEYFYVAFILNDNMDLEETINKLENSDKLRSMYKKNVSINKFIEAIDEVIKVE